MVPKLRKMARTGYAAKGIVYLIIGVLTFLAAFNMGGQKTGKLQVLQFLEQQPFGNFLLILIGLGISCYAVWRFIESISDPEHVGTTKKAKIKRTGYFISGSLYLGFVVIAFLRAFSSGTPAKSGNSGSSMLASEIGLILLGIVGIIIIGVGIYQFYRVKKRNYVEKFNFSAIQDKKIRRTIHDSANLGLGARGVVFLIIGYFAIRATLSSNPSQIKKTTDAFAFLEDSPMGNWLLGFVAAGFIAYAIFMFMISKYRRFEA